jgi:hypothetical protein
MTSSKGLVVSQDRLVVQVLDPCGIGQSDEVIVPLVFEHSDPSHVVPPTQEAMDSVWARVLPFMTRVNGLIP